MRKVINKIVYLLVFVSLWVATSGGNRDGFVIQVLNQTNSPVEMPILCDGSLKVSVIKRDDTIEVIPRINLSSYFNASHVNIDSIEVDGQYALKYKSIAAEKKIKWCFRLNISKRELKDYNVLIVSSPKGNIMMSRISDNEFAITRCNSFFNN